MTVKKKMLDSTLERLKNVLDEHYDGDFEYTFKFIVPFGKLEELKTILNEHNLIERSSRNGKYISVTMIRKVAGGPEVVELYEKTSVINGLIAL